MARKKFEVLYASVVLSIFRLAALWLPIGLLILVLLPPASVKAVIELCFKKRSAICFKKLSDGLTDAMPRVPLLALFGVRVRLNVNRLMTYWGGQLREPKWKSRIEYSGLEGLLDYVKSGRSVLLASVHYGSPREASTIIRSLGLRLAAIASDQLPPLEQKAVEIRDRLWGLGHVPVVLNPKDIWNTRNFLFKSGNMLLVLVDRSNNRRDITGDLLGGRVNVAKGVVTLAEITNAVVVPVTCTATGFLRWRLWFGEGLECVNDSGGMNTEEFCQQILQQLNSEIQHYPEQLHPELIGAMLTAEATE